MNLKRKLKSLTKESASSAPKKPGVYIFFDKKRNPIYVGKSKSLRNRLGSYYATNLSPKTAQIINGAEYFTTIIVTSELEALLLEAKLVKASNSKYNSQLKDDKNPLYIRITKEKYPRVLTARRIEENEPNIAFFGPFPSSENVKSVLKILRRIFPYAEHKPTKKRCLYSQMGLCDPCPSIIESTANQQEKKALRKSYLKNIRMIRQTLSGNISKVVRILEIEMGQFSKNEKFEEAEKFKRQLKRIEYVTQPITPVHEFVKNPNLAEDIRRDEFYDLKNILKPYLKLQKDLERIEAFDISHLSGVSPAASMVTFIKAEAEKNFYRLFRIRQKKGQDDTSSLKEVALRRIKHLKDWGKPDLILVDGGKAQVGVFNEIFIKEKIPVVGLAKRFETLVIPLSGNDGENFKQVRLIKGPAKNLLQRIRNEAHRFAQKYHHKLLTKKLIGS